MALNPMVDVVRTVNPDGRELLTVTTPKTKCDYKIQKTNDGFIFYEIKVTSGSLPKILEGNYSGPDSALEVLTKYIEQMKVTDTVRRDEYQEKRKKRNGAKLLTDNTDGVQQGASD